MKNAWNNNEKSFGCDFDVLWIDVTEIPFIGILYYSVGRWIFWVLILNISKLIEHEKLHPKTHPTKQAKTNKLNSQHMFHCQSQKMKTAKQNIFEIQILQRNINFIIAALEWKWRGGKFERILFCDNFTLDLKKIKFRQFYVTVFRESILLWFFNNLVVEFEIWPIFWGFWKLF